VSSDGLGTEVILVPVRHENRIDVVVRRTRALEPSAFLGGARRVRRDPIADGRVDQKLAAGERDQHPRVRDVADFNTG
jgi:hypothetical protein